MIAAGCIPAVPLVLAALMWILPGLVIALLVVSRVRMPVALRVDTDGVTLGNPFGSDVRIPWSDVDAAVTWKAGKTDRGNFMGVSASQDYRDRTGLSRKRFNRAVDNVIGMPIVGTTIRWQGPDSDVKRFAAAATRFAPHVPFVDPASRRPADGDSAG